MPRKYVAKHDDDGHTTSSPTVHPARHTTIHGALGRHRVRLRDNNEWGLLEEGDRHVELFGDALGRHMIVAGPDDVLDVQASPRVPRTNLCCCCRVVICCL